MRTPWTPRREMRTFCAASAAAVQCRSCFSVASPPARATRSASDGLRRTTIIRWPSATRGRGPPASPTQLAADCGAFVRAPPEAATSAATATRAARASAGRLRVRIERKILRVAETLCEACGRGDHGGVVGAELERSERGARDGGAELRVRRDPADDGDPLGAGRLGGLERPPDERADDRALVARGEIGAAPLELLRREVADRVEERRLQAGEGEVEAGHARDGERVRLRVALAREPVERAAARVAEPEQVVYGGERQATPEGDPLGSRDADEESADQSRAGRHGDELDVAEPRAGRVERVAGDARDELEVPPRGDLRDDTAEPRV